MAVCEDFLEMWGLLIVLVWTVPLTWWTYHHSKTNWSARVLHTFHMERHSSGPLPCADVQPLTRADEKPL